MNSGPLLGDLRWFQSQFQDLSDSWEETTVKTSRERKTRDQARSSVYTATGVRGHGTGSGKPPTPLNESHDRAETNYLLR